MTMRSEDRGKFLSWNARVPAERDAGERARKGAGSGVGERNYTSTTLPKSIGTLLCTALVATALGCAHHNADLSRPATQDNFGVQMAQMSLWREAMFRFQRAVELNPSDAMAHNNLAVAYEANGDFENAAKQYREALRLDRGNSYIQKNYSRYTEFMSRSKKRPAKGAPAKAATAEEGKKGMTPPTTMTAPPLQPPPSLPGTEALPGGIVPQPEVPMPGSTPVPPRRPPGGAA
jgi:tetratricopeptide (TPR) repeat protein